MNFKRSKRGCSQSTSDYFEHPFIYQGEKGDLKGHGDTPVGVYDRSFDQLIHPYVRSAQNQFRHFAIFHFHFIGSSPGLSLPFKFDSGVVSFLTGAAKEWEYS